jgi:hypothetical protein
MTGRIACNGGSPPRRALVQPALPLVSITQPTGRGSFEFSPNHPSPLRSVTVAGSLTRANLMESTMTASNGTDKSGKFYAPQPHDFICRSSCACPHLEVLGLPNYPPDVLVKFFFMTHLEKNSL